MANYKSIETLVKNLANVTEETLAGIIDNEMVDVSTLSDKEKFAVLVFAELAKALATKDHKLVMDCNYAASKFHNHEDEDEDVYKVDYFRLVPLANVNSTLIQFYVTTDPKKGNVRFVLCTSCAKANREQFEALEDDLHFIVKRDKNTGRAKTSQRSNIGYEEVVDIVKNVCAVLANTDALKAAAKKAKDEAKEEAKKAKAAEKKAPETNDADADDSEE